MLNCHLTRISSEEKNYGLLASCQHFFLSFFLHGGGLKSLNTHISSRYGGEDELVAEIKKKCFYSSLLVCLVMSMYQNGLWLCNVSPTKLFFALHHSAGDKA